MAQMDSMKFRIAKGDHEKALRAFTKILDYQRAHPELFVYTRTRTFFMDAQDNPEQEIWMFIDEYEDRKAYWESLQNARKNDPISAENYRAFMQLVVPGTVPKGHEVWTELEELRVEFDR